MQATKFVDVVENSLEEIKKLGALSRPCLSILMPLNPEQVPQNAVRLKHAASEAERILAETGVDRDHARQIADSIRSLAQELKPKARGLAVYSNAELGRAFYLPQETPESIILSGHFWIEPLISALQSERVFYVLALSQKHLRLLRCTEQDSVEIDLPPTVPTTLWEDKQSEQPDHDQDNRSGGGPGTGSMKGVVFTTNTDSEAHLEYLAHFYKHVSEGVTALLKEKNGTAPLVVAGVDYEIACFRRVNVYPNLAEDAVHGAADGLKGGELHKRALEAVQSYFSAPFKAALARYESSGAGRSSSTVKDIVKAAYEGRILDLVLAEGAQYLGVFDETTLDVKGHKQPVSGDEDLLNAAALETILHGGRVYIEPATQIPHGAPAIAVYRY